MKQEPRYCVEALEYATGTEYIIIDTASGRPVRHVGADFDEACEIAEAFNREGLHAVPFGNPVWSERERWDDNERSAILEERFTRRTGESGEER